tara:strand:- start:3887 stop:7084 length:3198 start_codon:yes stop_codon:yes gene_type:complete
MAKLPQLSSSRPAATPQLTGPLTLPTNFQAPPPSMGLSKALASIAGTTSDIGRYKQRLFDEEQDSLFHVADAKIGEKLFQQLTDKEAEIENSINQGTYVSEDGTAPVTLALESVLNDEETYNFPEFNALTDKRKEKVKTNNAFKYANKAYAADSKIRFSSKEKVGQIALQALENNFIGLRPTIDEENNINKNFVNNVKSYIAKAVELFGLESQKHIDEKAKAIVDRFLNNETKLLYFNNPKLFKEHSSKILDIFKDAEGNSLLSDLSIEESIDNFSGLISDKKATRNKEAIEEFYRTQNEAFSRQAMQPQEKLNLFNAENIASYNASLALEGSAVVKEIGLENFSEKNRKDWFDSQSNDIAYNLIANAINQTGGKPVIERIGEAQVFISNELEKYKEVVDPIKDPEAAITRNALITAQSELSTLLNDMDNPSYVKDAFSRNSFLRSGDISLKAMTNVIKDAMQLTGNTDFNQSKLPKDLVRLATEHVMAAHANPEVLEKNGITPNVFESFKNVLSNSYDQLSQDEIWNIFTGEVRNFGELDSGEVPGINFDLITNAMFPGGPIGKLKPMVKKDAVKFYRDALNDQNSRLFKLEQELKALPGTENSTSKRIKLNAEKERLVAGAIAKANGRRLHETSEGRFLFLKEEAFSPSLDSNMVEGFIQVGSKLAISLAFPEGVAEAINDYLPTAFPKVSVTGMDATPKPARGDKSGEDWVEGFKNLDWKTTRPLVKKTLIAAAEAGKSMGASFAAQNVRQTLSDIQNSSTYDIDSGGNVRFIVQVNSESPPIYSSLMTATKIQAFLGKEGMDAVKRYTQTGFPYGLPFNNFRQPIQDFFGLTEPIDEMDILETAIAPEEFEKNLSSWISNVDRNKLKPLGETEDDRLQKLVDGNYSLTVFKAPVAFEPKAEDFAERLPGIERSEEFNLDAAHILTRSFAFAFEGTGSRTFDHPENLDRAGVGLNRYLQNEIEKGIKKELKEWLANPDNPKEGLTAEWNVGTYSEDLATIDTFGFLDQLIKPVREAKTMLLMKANLVFKNAEGTEVGSWNWTVEDPGVLDMMSRSEVFNNLK